MRNLVIFLFALLCAMPAAAQSDTKANGWGRNRYISFYYGKQTLNNPSTADAYTSQFAVGLQKSIKTFRLHRHALGGVLYFGMDVAVDANFAKYKPNLVTDLEEVDQSNSGDLNDYIDEEGNVDTEGYIKDYLDGHFDAIDHMQLELGLAVGPYVEVAPLYYVSRNLRHLHLEAYYHALPSYSGMISSESLRHSFCYFHNAGVALRYKCVGVGWECRIGKAKYKALNFDELFDDDEDPAEAESEATRFQYKTINHRLFLRFNF